MKIRKQKILRAPKHPFPAPSDDCIAATEYIIENSESLKINKDKIVLAGDSAGGELAIVTAIEVKFRMPDFNFAGLVPLYPCTQFLTHRMTGNVKFNYKNCHNE